MRVVWRWTLILVLLSAVIPVLSLSGVIDSMLYYPQLASREAPRDVLRIPMPDGGSLAAVYRPNPQARHVIWFFHGNAEALGDLEPFLDDLHARGFAVFCYDYPGYGLSSGKAGERAIYAASDIAAAYLRDTLKVPLENVILVGRSLGGGPAVELATREPVAGLVLQSTFVSVFRVATWVKWLPFDQFKNLRKLPRVNCPVLVMHGTADEVIAFEHGEALYAGAKAPKTHLWIEGAKHNDFTDVAGERYWTALREFAADLSTLSESGR